MALARGRLRRLALIVLALAASSPGTAVAGPTADPAHPELSDRLDALDSPRLANASPADQAAAVDTAPRGAGSLQRVGRRIVVEIRFRKGARAARDELEAAGADVLHVSTEYQTVTAAVLPDRFAEVSNVPGVESVTESLAPMVGADDVGGDAGDGAVTGACPGGAATSEGDVRLRANTLRGALGVSGAGQKVGIISDSFGVNAAGVSGDIGSGDLPGPGNPCGRSAPVQVVDDDAGGADEGRAMLQIVHDLAPGAALAFADLGASQTEMADNIRALRAAGSTVISDDISYFEEPFFQKGPIENAIDQVTASGASYFTLAANMNVLNGDVDAASWETPEFRDSATCPPGMAGGYTCVDFDPDPAVEDPTLGVDVVSGRTNRFVLQWAEPWEGVDTDLDLFVFNGGTFVNTTTNNLTTQRPVDILAFTPASTGPRDLVIARFDGGPDASFDTPRVKVGIMQNGSQQTVFTEHLNDGEGDVVGPQIFGHNGAESASSVAAVDQADLTKPEDYSSRGPVTHYFGPAIGTEPAAALPAPKVIQAPDIAATDCTINTFFGPGNRFCGTSAAAPHAAAVGALMKAADPSLTPAQVRSLQAANARDVGAFGPFEVGAGLLDAAAAAPRPRLTVGGVGAFTNNRAPAITFSANRAATFSCRVDGAAARACRSPFATGALRDGAHTVTVTGTDALGHSGTGSRSFTVDTVAPTTSVTSGPTGPTKNSRPTFGFSSQGGVSTSCAFDDSAPVACSAPGGHRPGGRLRDGSHTFAVAAVDPAGNRSAATRSFSVDTKKPRVKVKKHPSKSTRSRRARFTFSVSERKAKLACRIDTRRFKRCKRTAKFTVGRGRHRLQVKATDAAGNVSKVRKFGWRVTR